MAEGKLDGHAVDKGLKTLLAPQHERGSSASHTESESERQVSWEPGLLCRGDASGAPELRPLNRGWATWLLKLFHIPSGPCEVSGVVCA